MDVYVLGERIVIEQWLFFEYSIQIGIAKKGKHNAIKRGSRSSKTPGNPVDSGSSGVSVAGRNNNHYIFCANVANEFHNRNDDKCHQIGCNSQYVCLAFMALFSGTKHGSLC